MDKFVRPALCHLCRFPLADAGVLMSNVDYIKLHLWWLNALQTELDEDELEKKHICQFCLWDAKFEDDRKNKDSAEEDCDWWKEHASNLIFLNYYYKAHLLRPCFVKMKYLTLPENGNGLSETSPLDPSQAGNRLMNVRPGKKPTDCVYCGAAFDSKKTAFVHAFKAHKTFSCGTCLVHFKSKSDRLMHLKSVHRVKSVCCHFCHKSSRYLKTHIDSCHPDVDFHNVQCCRKTLKSLDKLVSHMTLCRLYKRIYCVYCKESIKSTEMTNHVNKFHKLKAIKCDYRNCGKYFLSKKKRQQHIVDVHDNRIGLLFCIYCKRKFRRDKLSNHVLFQHRAKAIRCDFKKTCLTYFHSDKEKQLHMTESHMATKVIAKPTCIYCSNVFNWDYDLHDHIRNYHPLEMVICKVNRCSSKYFLTQDDLQKHFEDVHAAAEKDKIFQCSECGFGARKKYILAHHIIVKHLNQKLKCVYCQKIFAQQSSLQTHMKCAHEEAKTCIYCKKPAKRITTHLQVAPCRHCSKILPCRTLLAAHENYCARRSSK